MKLVSDINTHVTQLNRIHNGTIVKYTTDLETATSTDPINSSVDFKFHNSNPLHNAIFYQNVSKMRVLTHSMDLNLEEINTALYSGISFCHSYAYTSFPTSPKHASTLSETQSTKFHFVNETDFATTYSEEMNNMINNDVSTILKEDAVWSRVRHNFHIQNHVDKAISDKHLSKNSLTQALNIQVHITKHGLLFFRVNGEKRAGFAGALYIIPRICKNHRDKTPTPKTKPIIQVSTHIHAIVPLIDQLVQKAIESKKDLLSHATELLYYLNVLCIHSHKNIQNGRQSHDVLRHAWLVTYMIHASKICNRVHTSEFCRIY